jgi:hypothetical protein
MRYTHGKYDPAAFNVPPSLGKDGKSSRIQCHIQEGHNRMLEDFAHSGVFPFTTSSDVIRWCLDYALKELNRLEPARMNSTMKRTNTLIALAQEDVARSKYLEAFSVLRLQVNRHIGEGDIESAKDIIGRFRVEVEAMPENSDAEGRYKMRCQNELEPFRHLFRTEENS